MKKKLFCMLVFVCIIALSATIFVGCNKDGGKGLAAPTNIKFENDKFTWSAVEGADGYMVFVNDALNEFLVKETSVSINHVSIKGCLISDQSNVLWIKSVTLDSNGKVKSQSEMVKFEFDYVLEAGAEWTITLDLNYDGSQSQTFTVKNGEAFDEPAAPTRSGWKFEGWFRDKDGLIAAQFEDGKSAFEVSANTTLYAKWSQIVVPTTSVYFYSEWTSVSVKPYNGEEALFSGDGVAMTAVAGKANWFKADIDENATSVIFTNGTDSTEKSDFNKSTPYCKDGVWTETMPEQQVKPPVPTPDDVTISINGGTPIILEENHASEGEYMALALNLNEGDTVVITFKGEVVSNYEENSPFQGTAQATGKYDFYVSETKIWAGLCYSMTLYVGESTTGTDFEAYDVNLPEGVSRQYRVIVTLAEGDTVKILDSNGAEYIHYEPKCKFDGTVKAAGEHTFYVKIYADETHSIWVTAPQGENTDPEYTVMIIVDDDEENAIVLVEQQSGDPYALHEYTGKVTLTVGQTLKVVDSEGHEFVDYEQASPFKGTVIGDGEYTFYVKIYESGDAMYVLLPEGVEPTPQPDGAVFSVNGGEGKILSLNPADETEYMLLGEELAEGDVVVITLNGQTLPFDEGCGFNGTVTIAGKYDFYVKPDSVWVTLPSQEQPDPEPAEVTISINGGEEQALEANPADPSEYMLIGLLLNKGDTVVIKRDGEEVASYDENCGFNGTAGATGYFDFYVKPDSIWVATAYRMVYCYIDPSWNWDGLYVHSWLSSDHTQTTTWPGVKADAVKGQEGWFLAKVSVTHDMVILHDNTNPVGLPHKSDELNLDVSALIVYMGHSGKIDAPAWAEE